jgi:large subunit ribosomal protein L6
MSRVGKKPIPIPDKTKISYNANMITVQGEKGSLSREIHPAVDLQIDEKSITVIPKKTDKKSRALWGLTRSLLANMITGVSSGFERVLEINGIGYRAELSGKNIIFHLGYSHPISFDIPAGISVAVEKNIVRLSGIDKEALGHMAAAIRRLRPPDSYKAKGIKYAEEHIRKKAGKTGTK